MMNKRLNEEAKVKKVFAFLASFSTIGAVLAILQAYVIATIVDGVFLKDRGLSDVSILLGVLLFIFIGRGLLNYFTTKYGVKLASVVKMKLRNRLVDKLSSLQANQLYEEKTGKRVSVLTDAVDQLDAYYSSFLPQVFNAAIIPVMIVVVVFTQNIYSGLIMLITAPLIPVFMIIIGSMAEKKSKEQLNSMLRFSGHFLDVLQGIPMLKVFGQSKRQREKIIDMSNHFRDSTMDVLKIAFLSALMLEILATIATAMIAVEVGLRLVYGHLTFHTAFFVLLLAPELYMPLKNLGSSFHSGKNSISAAETIWEVLDKKETSPVWGSKKLNDVTKQTIKFENVSFQYNDKQQVLKNINVTINGRQRVAFVGKSGSGKTTLLKLLLGMLPPSEGQILINGVPLSELQEEQWLQSTAYVSQEPYIFSGTIKENIKVSNVNATDEEVYEAAKLAGVDRFVDDLPKRYDTSVGEAGIGLSGGEKQRIAVARAFLKKAAVVILDEPTAGLDLETESFLKEAIEKLCENATVLTVAHRLQTIVHSDQIVLLSEGEIVARGTHEQLLETSPLYQTIVSVYRGES